MSLRPIGALILREIATTHGRSFGGYCWMVVEPVAAICLISLVFSFFFAHPPLGTSFPMFYASGYLLFATYSDIAQKVAMALRYSRPLLAYPVVNWFDAVLARFLLALVTHALVGIVVIFGISWVEGLSLKIDIGVLVFSFLLAAFLGLAVGAMNIVLFEFVPVWERVWAIVNRPLFLLSGVLFLPEQLPAPYGDWLAINPLVQIISQGRDGLYPGYGSHTMGIILVGAAALSWFVMALILLGRHARGKILTS